MMKLCRFCQAEGSARIGLVVEQTVVDLTSLGISTFTPVLEADNHVSFLTLAAQQAVPKYPLEQVKLLAPIENQEVWAAGVTYLRSKSARMEESEFSANAYDRVYDAARPELFFKSMPRKVVPPGAEVGIRSDAKWNVPEPELVLVMNSRGRIVGVSIGNDMSSRDIEGENLLYLPQAKTYRDSCALGPWIALGAEEVVARQWRIAIQIIRGEKVVFEGGTLVGQLKRSFGELRNYLFSSQVFPDGVMLLTGTGVVPSAEFTLSPADRVRISVDGIGVLENTVRVV